MTKLASILKTGLSALAICSLASCVGAPPDNSDPVDPVDPVDPPVVTGQSVTGKVMDYTDPAGALSNFQVTADGLQVAVTATSSLEGDFELANIVEGSSIIPQVAPEAGNDLYRPTTNPPVLVGNADLTANVYAISNPYLTQQLANVGRTVLAPQTSVAFIELFDDLGQPLVGIPAADVVLADLQGNPVGLGPFFIGANNLIAPTVDLGNGVLPILESELHDGKARVVFLDVPAGNLKLTVANRSISICPTRSTSSRSPTPLRSTRLARFAAESPICLRRSWVPSTSPPPFIRSFRPWPSAVMAARSPVATTR